MATIEEFEKQTWDVINCYFENNKGYQLVKHQLESFNDFILRKLDQIIEGFNTIEIQHQFIPEVAKFKYMLTIDIKNPVISKPIIYEKDGSTKTMTPNDARQRNFTYSSNVNVDMIITAKTLGDNNEYTMDTKQINGVLLGKIPIMVKSNYCILNNKMALVYGNECKYDYGGYFLINGNEKVIISQDRISENKTYVFINNKISTYSHIAEIRSVQENKLGVPKITSLKLSAKGNQFGRFIRANIHHIKTDVPIFILFKALGLNNDKEIIKYIVYDLDDQLNSILINELIGSIEEANNIQCPKDALEYLSKYLNITGYPKEILNNKIHRINIIRNVLATEFLPHVGREFHKKALYLGYMVNKLLKCFLGLKEFDDRDSYINKKVDTPGVLMANLFRQYYGKVIKDMKNMIQKEINIGGWKATNKFINVINKVNIYKIVKSTIIDSGMRYALATGNWGIKNNKNKQGVAQVLNRMTYSATISHMRRINTPIEKSGKLVQPRKLHSTQWGIICPSECFDPDTPILMWNGSVKKAQDIIVGDYLIDDKGNSVRVRTTCSGHKTMYEIIPDKNNFMNYTVTDNHILTLKVKKHKISRNHRDKKELRWFDKKELRYRYKDFNNAKELNEFKSTIDDDNVIDITIDKYLSLPKNVQKELYMFKSDGINWEHKDVALDPYILGMWLGDGMSTGYGFASADDELINEWVKWGKNNDATIRKGTKYAYGISSTINNTQSGISCNKTEKAPLKKLLTKYNLVKNKHIPMEYLTNDRKTRLAVLAGLIDTDGNVRANGHEIRICQGKPNYQIIYDAEFLARSLGFSCHLNQGICSYTVDGQKRRKPYKELTITGQYLYEIPTVLPRKKLNKFTNPVSAKRCSSFLQSSFKLVKKDIQPFVGWQLEGSGRFLLKDAQVVHNTPEGSSVGLVKNMSMICSITISSNSVNVREIIREHGAIMFDGTNIEMFHKNTKIIVNGDIIGIHLDPYVFYNKLKADKLMGTINIYTSIVWNIKENEIAISTEGGRCVRPLYIVENGNRTKLTDEIIENIRHSKMEWKDLLINHGAIEFLDVEEANHSMTAMKYADILKGQKGALLPVKYTHLEIHPSLILGVLASTIPFSDHNQSPRNCFPVEDHEVLTAHGFIGLDKILEYTADGKELAVACHVNGNLEYHNIGRDRVVYQDDNGEILTATDFVSFESKNIHCERKIPGKTAVSAVTNKGISLLATTNHNMYGRLGFADKIGQNSYRWPQRIMLDRYRSVPPEYNTHEAGEVIEFAETKQPLTRGAKKIPVFQLQCNFNNGITLLKKNKLQFIENLGLITDDHIDAFLWFYGYWLGDGWLEGTHGYITVGPKKKKDIKKLSEIFNRLPLPLLEKRKYGEHGYWKASTYDSKGQWNFSICSKSWWDYFAEQYGHKYEGKYADAAFKNGAVRRNSLLPRTRIEVRNNNNSESKTKISYQRSVSPKPPDAEDINSAKWFWSWVFDSLDSSKLKIILYGLRYADGNESCESTKGGTIHTSSSRFRDEIERVCILAGYSVLIRFGTGVPGKICGTNASGIKIIARNYAWNVVYTTASVSATPYLEIGSEIKEVKMTEPIPIFCVAVPTESHLIMVRRKARGDQIASRATIVGNTYQCCKTDTPVLMADNTYKLIKDIKVGEEVITFDPITKYTNVTKVINQYVKPTELPIMEILTVSGRKITTTDNHHFMTNQGWKEVKHFDDDTCLSISMEQIPLSTECEEFDVLNLEILSKVLSSEKYNIKPHLITKYADTLQEINLLSIKSADRRLHILARMCGYLMTEGGIYKRHNKINNYFMKAYFETEYSANMFEDDIEYLGLHENYKANRKIIYNERDLHGQISNVYTVSHSNMIAILFMTLGVEPGRNKEVNHNQIPDWIMNGSLMVKREFLAGYQGGYGNNIQVNTLTNKGNNYVCAETSKKINPKYQDSLKSFFEQMNILYTDLGVETKILSTNCKYAIKMRDTQSNLLKYFDTIGYRYNYSKTTESAIIIEYIRYIKINKLKYCSKEDNITNWYDKIKHQGLSMFIPIKSITEVENCLISDITTESENHSFIAADGFMIHNSAQCKQAIGVYALNYRDRYDTLGHVMHYPQRPIVKTKMASILNTDNMPNGTNAIVAIACYTG